MEPTFQRDWRIKCIACYMVVSAQKNSEHEAGLGEIAGKATPRR